VRTSPRPLPTSRFSGPRAGSPRFSQSSFILGITEATASNSGCRIPRDELTPWAGDLIVTTPNVTISGYLVTGRILIRAANVIVRDNIVEAAVAATGTAHLIDTQHSGASNATIEFNDVSSSDFPNRFINGIGPRSYTAYRNHVFDVVDGFGVYDTLVGTSPAANVSILGNFVERLFYITPDPGHTDNRTHNDCIQLQGGPGLVTIEGNTLNGYDSPLSTSGGSPSGHALSCVMLNTTSVRYKSDVIIRRNVMRGGGYAVNGVGTDGGTITIENNRFGDDHDFGPISLCITLSTVWIIATAGLTVNTYEDGSSISSSATYTASGQTMRRYF
jgi:hypothetical protein